MLPTKHLPPKRDAVFLQEPEEHTTGKCCLIIFGEAWFLTNSQSRKVWVRLSRDRAFPGKLFHEKIRICLRLCHGPFDRMGNGRMSKPATPFSTTRQGGQDASLAAALSATAQTAFAAVNTRTRDVNRKIGSSTRENEIRNQYEPLDVTSLHQLGQKPAPGWLHPACRPLPTPLPRTDRGPHRAWRAWGPRTASPGPRRHPPRSCT